MCFTVSEKYPNELTAEEDIVVYKYGKSILFDLFYKSPIEGYLYLKINYLKN